MKKRQREEKAAVLKRSRAVLTPKARDALELGDVAYYVGNIREAYQQYLIASRAGSREGQRKLQLTQKRLNMEALTQEDLRKSELQRQQSNVSVEKAKVAPSFAIPKEDKRILVRDLGCKKSKKNKQSVVTASKSEQVYTRTIKDLSVESALDDTFIGLLRDAKKGDVESQFLLARYYETQGNIKESAKWCKKAANNGLFNAVCFLHKLGECFELGDGVHIGEVEAYNCYKIAAKLGYADSQYKLGVCFAFGKGVYADMKKARYYWRLAADSGHEEAKKLLGEDNEIEGNLGIAISSCEEKEGKRREGHNCHADEYFVSQHSSGLGDIDNNTIEELKQVALAKAYYRVAEAFEKTLSHEEDKILAIPYYEKAAQAGSAEAYYRMGEIEELCGKYNKAIKFYGKAKDMGHPDALSATKRTTKKMRELFATQLSGRIAEKGKGARDESTPIPELSIPEKSAEELYQEGMMYLARREEACENWRAECENCFLLASQHNHADSLYILGTLFVDDENISGAVTCFQKAAEQGHAEAQYNMGVYCEQQISDKFDLQHAFEYFKASAAQGVTDACYKVGLYYLWGVGGVIDEGEAFVQFCKAADAGHNLSAYYVALGYLCGRGVTQSAELSIPYLCLAADGGIADAVHLLALCYKDGYGIEEDKNEAYSLFLCASEKGHVPSEYQLGECYELGCGVAPDCLKAKEWYEKAVSHGDADASAKLASQQWIIRNLMYEMRHGSHE